MRGAQILLLVTSVCLAAGDGGSLAASLQQSSSNTSSTSVSDARAFLDQYCVSCHNERLKTAELALDRLDVSDVGAGAEVWEKVVVKLRAGMMPPQGRSRPTKERSEALVAWLEAALDRAAAADPKPGQPLVHRLNRVEYANVIRDLLAIDIDSTTLLPPDDASYGFDNIADVLGVSPALM